MKPCFYKLNGRYLHAELIDGPYDFKNAVRIKLRDNQEILTTMDRIVFEKPQSAHRIEIEKRMDQRRRGRVEFVLQVMAALPGTTRELADRVGCDTSMIYQRICYWSEFENVKLENGKFQIKT